MSMNPIPPAQECYYAQGTCSCLWTFHFCVLETPSLWVVLASIHLDFDSWQLFYVAKNLVPEIFYSSGLAHLAVFNSWVFFFFLGWGEWVRVWNNWQFCWLGIIVMLILWVCQSSLASVLFGHYKHVVVCWHVAKQMNFAQLLKWRMQIFCIVQDPVLLLWLSIGNLLLKGV